MHLDTARADRVTAIVLCGLGLAMLIGGFTMDRLPQRDIHPTSIPGLVPMILGAVLALCAVLLYAGARDTGADTPEEDAVSWRNFSLALALCLIYAIGLVGRLPFFWATAVFVAAFAAIFAWPETAARRRPRLVATAVAFGLVVAGAITGLFRYGFLVRLP